MKIEANLERRGQLYEMQMAWVLDMDALKPFDQNISPWQIPDWNGILQFGWKPGSGLWTQSEPGWERFWEQKDTQFEWNGKQEPLFVYWLVPFLSGHQEACVCVLSSYWFWAITLGWTSLSSGAPQEIGEWGSQNLLPLPLCSPCLSVKSTAARAWHWDIVTSHIFGIVMMAWTECSSLGLILLTSFSYCAVGILTVSSRLKLSLGRRTKHSSDEVTKPNSEAERRTDVHLMPTFFLSLLSQSLSLISSLFFFLQTGDISSCQGPSGHHLALLRTRKMHAASGMNQGLPDSSRALSLKRSAWSMSWSFKGSMVGPYCWRIYNVTGWSGTQVIGAQACWYCDMRGDPVYTELAILIWRLISLRKRL